MFECKPQCFHGAARDLQLVYNLPDSGLNKAPHVSYWSPIIYLIASRRVLKPRPAQPLVHSQAFPRIATTP